METRHLLQRMSPGVDWRLPVGLLVAGIIAVAVSFVRGSAAPPLELVALGPQGSFVDTLDVPADWGDTATSTPDGVIRVPLILGVRNAGTRPVRPARITLGLPVRYRLAAGGQELAMDREAGSPLVRYSLDPRLEPVQPGRLPVLLPALDTLWLEVVVPRVYCVALADSIPEFLPAPPPAVGPLSRVRIFYAFEGGDLSRRRTGTLSVRIDSSLLHVQVPETLPTFPMETDAAIARPPLGTLAYEGARRSRCGEPEDPMELLSSVWTTTSGGRFITLDYGGKVRKQLYDLDGDGVVERESWDPDGDGSFEATRRARLPIPDFLLPRKPDLAYPMARFDSLAPDSLARLDPFRRAMTAPGAVPGTAGDTLARVPGLGQRRGVPGAAGAGDLFDLDSLPTPTIRPAGPLGQPIRRPPPRRPPPDTGAG